MNESFWSYKDCNNSDPYIHIEIYLNCKVNIQNFNLCKNLLWFPLFYGGSDVYFVDYLASI